MARGYIRFSLTELRKVLQLPEAFEIGSIHADPLQQSVYLIVEHPDIPAVSESAHLLRVTPDYEWHTDLDKQEWRRLQGVINMDGSKICGE